MFTNSICEVAYSGNTNLRSDDLKFPRLSGNPEIYYRKSHSLPTLAASPVSSNVRSLFRLRMLTRGHRYEHLAPMRQNG